MNGSGNEWSTRRIFGRTGLEVCRLGISASYGVPAAAVERAFEHGVNYLYWGSRRSDAFAQALRNLAPRRDRMVLLLQSYSRIARLVPWSIERALRTLHYDHADILLLGMWNHAVSPRIVEECRKLKERGIVRFLALSTHRRPLIPELDSSPDFDAFHVRYNAVHRGAEREVFPKLAELPEARRPGLASFTATCWRRLLGHRRIPKNEKIPTAADCYRFALSQPAIDICLTGPATAQHVDEALSVLDRGPMMADELAWMRRVGSAIYGKS